MRRRHRHRGEEPVKTQAEGTPELAEAGKDNEGFIPRVSTAPSTPLFQIPGLQKSGRMYFCCFKPQSFFNLL